MVVFFIDADGIDEANDLSQIILALLDARISLW